MCFETIIWKSKKCLKNNLISKELILKSNHSNVQKFMLNDWKTCVYEENVMLMN